MQARIALAFVIFAAIGYALGTLQPHGTKATMEMEQSEFFNGFYSHLVPHPLFGDHGHEGDGHAHEGEAHEGEAHGEGAHGDDGHEHDHGPSFLTFYDVNLWQIISVLLMGAVLLQVKGSFGKPGGSWLVRVFRGWCRWIRDEMVAASMEPEDVKRFTPYFIYLFFFIAFANLLGMLPNGTTATATLFVTGTLAIGTLGIMLIGGMMRQGVGAFWKNLVPHGLPLPLIPLMAVLEFIGLLVKPFALMIRLFANMLAGHLVLYSFIALIFLAAKGFEMSVATYGLAILPVGMGVFISIIECFVALLQAYIFTLLSIIFVQAALHPEH